MGFVSQVKHGAHRGEVGAGGSGGHSGDDVGERRPECVPRELVDDRNGDIAREFSEPVGECGIEELVFGVKEIVEGAAGKVGFPQDVGESGVGEAMGGEDDAGGGEEPGSAFRVDWLGWPGHSSRLLVFGHICPEIRNGDTLVT